MSHFYGSFIESWLFEGCRWRIRFSRSSFHFSSRSPCAQAGMLLVGMLKFAIADIICEMKSNTWWEYAPKNTLSNILPVRLSWSLGRYLLILVAVYSKLPFQSPLLLMEPQYLFRELGSVHWTPIIKIMNENTSLFISFPLTNTQIF